MGWISQADATVLRVKQSMALRSLKRFNVNSFLQSLGFFVLLGIFWLLCFLGVARLCNNLYSIELIGPIILSRILSLGFLAAFMIVAGGHILTALSSLFRGAHLYAFVESPYPMSSLYRVQCIETVLRGGWGLGLFCVPIVLAYGIQLDAPLWYYPVVLIGLLGFLLIAGMTGITVMIVLARWVLGRPIRMLVGMSTVAIGFISVFLSTLSVSQDFLANDITARQLGQLLANMKLSTNPYLPSQWIAQLMTTARNGSLEEMAIYLTLLLAGALFMWCLVMELGLRWYSDAWLWAQERIGLVGSRREGRAFKQRRMVLLQFLPRKIGAMIYKEIYLFLRDFSQWGQLILILALVLFYVAHIQNQMTVEAEVQQRNQLAFFNLILLGFIQATISLRYTFPSISLEGKGYWAIRSSGMSVPFFFLTKYYIHATALMVIGLGMGWLLNQIMQVDATLQAISFIILLLFSFGFTSWTLGMGAVFHNFNVSSVAEVSSNTGALVTMILTLIYFGVSVVFIATYALQHTPGLNLAHQLALQQNLIGYIGAFLLLQTGAILFPVIYGIQSLQESDL